MNPNGTFIAKARWPAAAALLAGGLIFLVGLGGGLLVQRWFPLLANRSFLNTSTVVQQIQTLSQLVTVQYTMEKVVVLEDIRYIAILGESRVLLVAHGVVKAGIDLSALRPEDLKVSGKSIRVRLPRAKITDAYLDDSKTRVVERTTGLLRTFDKNMEQEARQNAVNEMRLGARAGGILNDAQTRAELQIKTLLLQMGFEKVVIESQ